MDAPDTTIGAPLAPDMPERVYLAHYGLKEAPFSITPDPEFLYAARCHREVIEKIVYAIDCRMGFVLLTGEVGTGKTTVCRTLLDGLADSVNTAYVINPSVSGRELLTTIIEDSGEAAPQGASRKALLDQLHQRLLATTSARPFVVIIDDAQTMPPETLEDLRLLSNLETDKHKLVQVILSGQPELLHRLKDSRLRQLRQRIAVHCHLAPLCARETAAYIDRRLFVAGNKGQVHFTPAAERLVHKRSAGIPRLINKVCDCALTAGYVKDAAAIDSGHVRWALAELDGLHQTSGHGGNMGDTPGVSMAAMLAVGLLATVFFTFQSDALTTTHESPKSSVPQKAVTASLSASLPTTLPLERQDAPPALDAPPEAGQALTAEPPKNQGPKDKRSAVLPPAPFTLQLASFRDRTHAIKGTAQFRRQGVPACWQMVDGGRWYRLFTGRFTNRPQAAHYMRKHGLDTAIIVKAPLTLSIAGNRDDVSRHTIQQMLMKAGYDSTPEMGGQGDPSIFAGCFPTREDAQIAARRIRDGNPLKVGVVNR